MMFSLHFDASSESGIEEISYALQDAGFESWFQRAQLGQGLRRIVVVLMCIDQDFEWKPRRRFQRTDATIYTDIVFNFSEFTEESKESRRRLVAEALLDEMTFLMGNRDPGLRRREVPACLSKEDTRFEVDLRRAINADLPSPEGKSAAFPRGLSVPLK